MQPDGSGDWDLQHLSNVKMIVWKVSADLSESGGGILLDVAGALSGAALPSEFSVGMQVRLDNIPTKFLVGVKNMAVALLGTWRPFFKMLGGLFVLQI
jgi:hypothetical protein